MGFFTSNEGVLLESPNLFDVDDPSDAIWNTLPDDEIGLRTPPGGGPISEEHHYVVLSDGSFYSLSRTVDGYPVFTTSRDRGHIWDIPEYVRYANGRYVKNPRGPAFIFKCRNGKYLLWFYNNGGNYISEHPRRLTSMAFFNRNPVWVSGGTEIDTDQGKTILWSQAEILFYCDDPIL